MAAQQIVSADPGTAPFVPHVADNTDDPVVSLLRRLPDGGYVAVWSHACERKDAGVIGAWMLAQPESWSLWGRIALRLGGDTLSPLVVDGARAAEAKRLEEARVRQEEEREAHRLAGEITLYYYDPKGRPPALGLQRGTQDRPFWKMRFTEKWERDRVVDWLRWQPERFSEFAEYQAEHGDLELERLVLAGMRKGEREAKAKKITSSGRRPLRFWRGE